MNENPNEMAMAYGIVAMLAAFLASGFWMLTRELAPIERRAWRLAMLSGLVAATIVVVAEVKLHDMNALAGSFMVGPTIFLTAAAFWCGWRWTYRAAGGGKQASPPPASPVEVEPATLEGQDEIWCQLRALPQFRETTGGNLISLVTGDELNWQAYQGKRCIQLKLGGHTHILGARYETLTKYLQVQMAIASHLGQPSAPTAEAR